MKRLIICLIVVFGVSSARAQCVNSNCSTYVAQPITYTTFPTTGNSLVLGDDQMSAAIPIGFNFDFYCNTYSQVEVSSNGFLTFDLNAFANGCCSGMSIPSGLTPNNFVALFWNDLNPNNGGTITYTTIGTSPNQIFIVSFNSIPHYNGGGNCTGQMVLYETSNTIEIYTASYVTNNNPCTQGIENSGGTAGAFDPSRNGVAWNATNSGYRFGTVVPTPPSAITGVSSACLNGVVTFSASGHPSILSYVWALPGGWTGTSTTSVISPTVGSSGSISVSAIYSCGISTPTTFVFNTNPLPIVTIQSPTPALICSGSTVALNTGGALTYTLEPGSNSSGPPFIVNPTSTTVYTLSGTDANGCVSNNSPTVSISVNETPTVTINSGAICLGESFTLTPSGATIYTLSSGFSIVTPNTAGVQTYTVVGTNSTGCVSLPAISSLTVNALPNVTAISTRTTICRNESTTLTASGAVSYSWNTGPTTAAIVVSPQNNTTYTVNGIDANNCGKKASVNVVVSLCLGVNETTTNQTQLVSVFPNPSNGEFTLNANENTEVQIYDIQGKLIKTVNVTEGSHKIDLSAYAAGEYILKANTKDKHQQIILIKE